MSESSGHLPITATLNFVAGTVAISAPLVRGLTGLGCEVLLVSLVAAVSHPEAALGQLASAPLLVTQGLSSPWGLHSRVTSLLMWWHRAPQSAKVGAARPF